MEFPMLKSCFFMNLKTGGQVLAYIQFAVYGLAIMFSLANGGYLLLPIILVPVATNICWIYGIREKKPMLMLPAMAPFVIASLAAICFVAISPIFVAFSQPAFMRPNRYCTSHGYYTTCTIENPMYDNHCDWALTVWIVGCAISCIIMYMTVVLYSVYKSVEEECKQNQLIVSTSAQIHKTVSQI